MRSAEPMAAAAGFEVTVVDPRGAFASPEHNILFDINDFDETLPGVDFTLDVKRLAASVAVAELKARSARLRIEWSKYDWTITRA